MSEKINYSIITPAHNSSGFIKKLLDSTPRRTDIEVIIIDDHSSDYEKLKQVINQHVLSKQIKLKQNSGEPSAGAARNVGLDMARGKWLIFADSDDYFTPDFSRALDEYANDVSHVVLFPPVAKLKGSNAPSNRADFFKHIYKQFSESEISREDLSYRITPIWSRFYKRKIVKEARFRPTKVANDVAFSMEAAFATRKNIKVNTSYSIYTIVERAGSITKHKRHDLKRLYIRSRERLKADYWLRRQLKIKGEIPPKLLRNESIFRKFYGIVK